MIYFGGPDLKVLTLLSKMGLQLSENKMHNNG